MKIDFAEIKFHQRGEKSTDFKLNVICQEQSKALQRNTFSIRMFQINNKVLQQDVEWVLLQVAGFLPTPQRYRKYITSHKKKKTSFPEPLVSLFFTDDSEVACLYSMCVMHGKMSRRTSTTKSNFSHVARCSDNFKQRIAFQIKLDSMPINQNELE